jgi:tape measure domain-containing protein
MAASIGDIWAALNLDASGFTTGLANAQKGLFRFVHMAENTGGALVDMARNAVTAGMETAQALEVAHIAIGNMAGSAEEAGEFIKDLRKFAEQTPFAFEKMTNEVRKLQGAGLELKDMIPILTVFGDQVSAMGTGADGLKHLVKAFTDMKGMGKIMTADMNQLQNSGFRAWDTLAKHLGTTVAGAREKVQNEFVSSKGFLEVVLRDMMATTGGQMNKMAMTLGGMWEAFTDHAKLAMADGLAPFVEALKGIIPILAETMRSGGDFFKTMVDGMVFVVEVTGAVLAAYNALSDETQNLIVWTLAGTAALTAMGIGFIGAAFAVSAFVSSMVTLTALLFTPVGLVIAASLAYLGIVLGMLAFNAATLGLAWSRNWYGMKDATLSSVDSIVTTFTSAMDLMTFAINEFAKDIVDVMDPVLTTLADFWYGVGQAAEAVGAPMAPILTTMADGMGRAANAWHNLRKEIDETTKVSMEWNPDSQDYQPVSSGLTTMLSDLKAQINRDLTDGIMGTGGAIAGTFQALVEGPVADMFNAIAPDDIKKALQDYLLGFTELDAEGAKVLDGWLEDFLSRWTDGADTGGEQLTKKEMSEKEYEAWRDGIGMFWNQMASDQKIQSIRSTLFDEQISSIQTSVDEFNADFRAELDKLAKEFELAAAEQKKKNNEMIGGIIQDAGSEEVNGMMSSISMFTALLGPIGTLIGILWEFIKGLEFFSAALQIITDTIEHIQGWVNPLLSGLTNFIKTIGDLLTSIVDAFMALGAADLLQDIGKAFQGLAAALQPIIAVFKMISSSLGAFSKAMGGSAQLLDTALGALFEVFKVLGLVVMGFVYVLASVWNGVLSAIAAFLDAITLHKAADEVRSAMADTAQMEEDMGNLMDMSYADAKALSNHADAADEGTEAMKKMTEELLNVPVGYKVALTRWQEAFSNMDIGADSGGPQGGANRGDGPGGGRGNVREPTKDDLPGHKFPHLADGGIVRRKTVAVVGEAGPEAVVPLSKMASFGMGGSSIHIENLLVVANDPKELQEALEKIAKRKALVQSGKVSTNIGPKFSAE